MKACIKRAISISRYRSNNRLKVVAHNRLRYAVLTNKISRKPCEICGNEITQAHHEDYLKPLDVKWLCPACHGQRHREIRLKA